MQEEAEGVGGGESDGDDDNLEIDEPESPKDVSIRETGGKKGKKKGGKKKLKPKSRKNLGGFNEFITSDKVQLAIPDHDVRRPAQ